MAEKEYKTQLKEIAKRRDDIEDRYRQDMKHVEDVDYNISRHMRMTREISDDNPILSTNHRLQAIYGERESVLRNMRQQNEDFNNAIAERHRKELSKLDKEEYELRKKIKAEKNDKHL